MFEGMKRVHFTGIGGIGVSALAKLCLARGMAVSGSDLNASAITADLARRGAKVAAGSGALPEKLDLLVYSPAVPETDPERAEAARRGTRQLSYPEALGEMSRQMKTVVVTGTNGKSTTAAMLGLILEAAGMDPTVIVGSLVPGFPDGNLRAGGGKLFVVEGCEYRANVLNLHPSAVVLTNVEEDHLDYFRDIGHIRDTFQQLIDACPGAVAWNADDPNSRLLKVKDGVSYAMDAAADVNGENRRVEAGAQSVDVRRHGVKFGSFTLRVPGAFNAMNALAATAMAMELGVPFETCARTLEAFRGIWRRFERVGDLVIPPLKGGTEGGLVPVISDYGHHPTAIRGTIEAAREFFPGRRVVLCFQPHQHSRTLELKDDFIAALQGADAVVIPEIYGVAGRTEEEAKLISSKDLAAGVPGAAYAKDLAEAEALVRGLVRDGDVLLVQGAGDVDGLARRLVR